MIDAVETKLKNQVGVLVAVAGKRDDERILKEHLDELAFLASTAKISVRNKFFQRLEKPDRRTFVGQGKLEEIKAYCASREIDVVIFDDDLTPSQLRNIEREFKCKIYDRSLLILDIFLNRAQTAQSKTQVELARYQYLMPRLTRMWTHLERQRGGTGTRGGAGEKEIETDRRMIRNQITVLKKKLDKIERQNEIQRKNRSQVVRAALVGYTNVGKSTLMRLLSKSDVKAEDKLFATVDATVRKVVVNNIPFLLSDTVGFIRKLPHHLIESFKSTLAEVQEADILIHVIDVSHTAFEDHIKVVRETLKELNAIEKPTLYVFNKIDLLPDDFGPIQDIFVEGINKSDQKVFISAGKKQNISELRQKLFEMIKVRHYQIFPNFWKADEEYWQ
ncbi:GTPase HflX [Fulvivirga sp. M361]|uniref:GTPase HflX n=1 Tax=Fulvivirga sp. M361 TaxID=2594266 RepID=UPI00117A05E9|nr:GTPase HflX [Fulvivirga sp. M361]TRX48190.1 GTPase HflX [Fulvivirga sp. M361]